jgi:hypothetical protein
MARDLPQKTAEGAKKRRNQALRAVEPARRAAVARRAGNMPVSMRKGYFDAASGKASPRAAIRAHCLECVGWEREEVPACTAVACPLYLYRPFQGGSHE